MDDEFYDVDGHDDGQQFADAEEEAHFRMANTMTFVIV